MRLLLADDHGLIRDLIRIYIEKLEPTWTVSTTCDLPSAISHLRGEEKVDLVLLDLMMPGMDGAAGLAAVRAVDPQLPVAIISATESPDAIWAVLRAGAAGFIPKAMSAEAMVAALRLIAAGERYVPWAVIEAKLGGSAGKPANGGRSDAVLSRRERQVLDQLIQGKSNKEIARSLELREPTIKMNLRNAYRKLGVRTRTQAIMKLRDKAPDEAPPE